MELKQTEQNICQMTPYFEKRKC